MKDVLGKELHVGDNVVYVVGSKLHPGVIKKIFGEKECTVNSTPHVYPSRIAKIPN